MISATERTWNTSLAQGYYFPWHVFSYRKDMRYDFTTRMLISLPCFSVTERAWNMTLRMLFPWHVFSYIQDIKYDFDTRMLFPWHVFSHRNDMRYDFDTGMLFSLACVQLQKGHEIWLWHKDVIFPGMFSATEMTWDMTLAQGCYFPWHVFSHRNDMRYDFDTGMLFSLACVQLQKGHEIRLWHKDVIFPGMFSATERTRNMTLAQGSKEEQ